MPLRPGFEPRAYPSRSSERRVLVLGGSQGATALNERVPGAIARASANVGDLHVVHQTGKDREADVRQAYERAGIATATVVPFLDDVAEQMAAADVVVARAGAVTVAEILAIGRASILVPFPHAADDHQAKNAMALADLGGAVCIRQEAADEVRLATELTLMFEDAERRTRMAQIARDHGHPHAAEEIARDLLALSGIRLKPAGAPPPHKPMNGGTNGSSTMKLPISSSKGVS